MNPLKAKKLDQLSKQLQKRNDHLELSNTKQALKILDLENEAHLALESHKMTMYIIEAILAQSGTINEARRAWNRHLNQAPTIAKTKDEYTKYLASFGIEYVHRFEEDA